MWCDVFRYRFTQTVDQPNVKKGIGAAFVVLVGLGLVAGYVTAERYRDAYCKDHNCNHVISNDDGTFEGFMLGFSIVAACTTFVCLSVMCIICCRVKDATDTAYLMEEGEQRPNYGTTSIQ